MARMAGAGTLDLSHLTARHFTLDEANAAVEAASTDSGGGFTSVVVRPHE
jgi:hypothetical protein